MTKQMLAAMASGLALMAAVPAVAQQGGSTVTAATTQGPILSFSVSEEVRSRPDQATVGAGVTTTAPTAVEAMRANAAAMDKLIAAAKARGIKAEDIQTSGINLSPQYDYNNRGDGQPPRFLGYQVSNSVRATTPKIDDIGPLLDALVATGGTNVDGPWFGMKDPDAQLVGARGSAIKAAEAKAADYYEQLLRATAEMENVRRRAREDVSKAHKFAVESFAESLLPVRDSLEMALAVPAPSLESLREGVEATLRQLTQAFERNKVQVIDPLHQKFDPNHHQAISMAPSAEVPANHVLSVLQKGYLINDRILRPALVTVSQGA